MKKYHVLLEIKVLADCVVRAESLADAIEKTKQLDTHKLYHLRRPMEKYPSDHSHAVNGAWCEAGDSEE